MEEPAIYIRKIFSRDGFSGTAKFINYSRSYINKRHSEFIIQNT